MATGIKEIVAFFGMKLGDFQKEWKQLTDEDKAQIRQGFEDGSYNY